jgi:hypothetical protein
MSKKRRGQGQATVRALRKKDKAPDPPTDKERRRENWKKKKTG